MFVMRDFLVFCFYPTFLCGVFLREDNFPISKCFSRIMHKSLWGENKMCKFASLNGWLHNFYDFRTYESGVTYNY